LFSSESNNLRQNRAKYRRNPAPARNRHHRDISNGLRPPIGQKCSGFDRADRGLANPIILPHRLQGFCFAGTLAGVAVGVRTMLMIAGLPESASGFAQPMNDCELHRWTIRDPAPAAMFSTSQAIFLSSSSWCDRMAEFCNWIYFGRAARSNGGCAAVVLAIAVSLLAPVVCSAVVVGQVDDFEDGTTQDWQSGASNPNGPVNVATGGPAGAGDSFLRLTSNGSGSGGKLAAFCIDQWAGDYLTENVNSIQMQVKNLGATNLVLRLILENEANSQNLGTISPVNLPAGSDWTTVSFSLAAGNLTGGNYATVMSNVTTFDIAHGPSPISVRSSSPNIVAQLGIDNITAVPEPNAIALAVAALAMTVASAGRRRAKMRHRDGTSRGVGHINAGVALFRFHRGR
jgi:hypothetical protein